MAPTWSDIYNNYLQGDCASCHTHSSNMGTATKAYSYLQGMGYISGTSSPLVDPSQSCLTWVSAGGNMPPNGGSNAQAVSDLDAWAAAGALDN
jgi:hypothetical protein